MKRQTQGQCILFWLLVLAMVSIATDAIAQVVRPINIPNRAIVRPIIPPNAINRNILPQNRINPNFLNQNRINPNVLNPNQGRINPSALNQGRINPNIGHSTRGTSSSTGNYSTYRRMTPDEAKRKVRKTSVDRKLLLRRTAKHYYTK